MSLKHAWNFMISLFDFKCLECNIRDELPKGKGRFGVPNYGAGILLALFSMFVLTLLAIVLAMLAHDSFPPGYASVSLRPELTYGFFVSSIIYFGIIMFPYLMLGSFIYQGFAYGLLRILGGKGDFRKQYFITSYIALALGIGSLGSLFTMPFVFFLPCVTVFFFLTFFVTAIYLVFFVQTKMLVEVHRVKPLAALAVVFITTIASLAMFAIVQFLVGHFGLSPDFTSTFGFPQLNGSLSDINVTLPQMSGISGGNGTQSSLNVTDITNATNMNVTNISG